MKKYELIIFDCDGTLVDSENLFREATIQTLNELGHELIGCHQRFAGVDKNSFLKLLAEEFGPSFDPIRFEQRLIDRCREMTRTRTVALPNAYDALKMLEQYQTCVASNGERDIVISSLEASNLIDFFEHDTIFTYQQVKMAKPEPDLFLYAASQIGIDPSKCLVIEDSAVGINAAQKANMDVLCITQNIDHANDNLRHLKPNAIITDLRQISEFLS